VLAFGVEVVLSEGVEGLATGPSPSLAVAVEAVAGVGAGDCWACDEGVDPLPSFRSSSSSTDRYALL